MLNEIISIFKKILKRYYHERLKKLYNFESLSDYLPYDSYDEENKIYLNKGSVGFYHRN